MPLSERVGEDAIAELVAQEGNIAETFDHLSAFLVPGD
jgi:hypothetical protein